MIDGRPPLLASTTCTLPETSLQAHINDLADLAFPMDILDVALESDFITPGLYMAKSSAEATQMACTQKVSREFSYDYEMLYNTAALQSLLSDEVRLFAHYLCAIGVTRISGVGVERVFDDLQQRCVIRVYTSY